VILRGGNIPSVVVDVAGAECRSDTSANGAVRTRGAGHPGTLCRQGPRQLLALDRGEGGLAGVRSPRKLPNRNVYERTDVQTVEQILSDEARQEAWPASTGQAAEGTKPRGTLIAKVRNGSPLQYGALGLRAGPSVGIPRKVPAAFAKLVSRVHRSTGRWRFGRQDGAWACARLWRRR